MSQLILDTMDGREVYPGIFVIGEPTPVEGTNTLRALANVRGCLACIELRMTFGTLPTKVTP